MFLLYYLPWFDRTIDFLKKKKQKRKEKKGEKRKKKRKEMMEDIDNFLWSAS
jgi:hypothetical protein